MKSVSVLYVEDNNDVREAITMMMEDVGREVVTCATGEEALVKVAERKFDVLVADVSLPGMSGTDLARRLLAINPAQPVVLCSGYQFGPALRHLGPNVRSLIKPFEAKDLNAVIDEIA